MFGKINPIINLRQLQGAANGSESHFGVEPREALVGPTAIRLPPKVFDLGPILGEKDGDYNTQDDPANTVEQQIIDDPVLQKYNTRIIAEPWGGGGSPMGQFPVSKNRPTFAWAEWNGLFRDWVRSFVNYDDWGISNRDIDGGNVLTGTSKLFAHNKRAPHHSVNFVSIHGWHRMVGIIARNIENGEFEALLENIPLHEQREKWRTARSGFSQADLDNATRKIEVALAKVEAQLAETPWLAGDVYTLADINFYSHCGMMVDRMFPEMEVDKRFPRLVDWRRRVDA